MTKTVLRIFRSFPLPVSLWIARVIGRAGYYLLPKKRAVIYANVKTAFSATKLPFQLQTLTQSVFINLAQSFGELLCMSKIKRLGFTHFVEIQGKEHVDQAMHEGKGLILLAIHSGNWELGNILNALIGYPYHVVANQQPKAPEFNLLLDECRRMSGGHVITAGSATKEIIKALKGNEIVSLVLDQGGQEGIPVRFLGKTAAMSTGAVRLALKYGCAICPVWIVRKPSGGHVLNIAPPMTVTSTGHLEKDIELNVQRASRHFERLLEDHPDEYLWPYKVFKYTTEAHIMVLDGGQPEDLRQSQAMAGTLTAQLNSDGKKVKEKTAVLNFRKPFGAKAFRFYLSFARLFSFLRGEQALKYFLTMESYLSLMNFKADFVISCGWQAEGMNFILSKNHLAQSILLKPVLS